MQCSQIHSASAKDVVPTTLHIVPRPATQTEIITHVMPVPASGGGAPTRMAVGRVPSNESKGQRAILVLGLQCWGVESRYLMPFIHMNSIRPKSRTVVDHVMVVLLIHRLFHKLLSAMPEQLCIDPMIRCFESI